MEQHLMHPIKEENIKIEQKLHTEINLKDEVLEESKIKRKILDTSVPMVLTSDNFLIKSESSLHTELIIKDEDINETFEYDNNSNVDEQTLIDRSGIKSCTVLEIKALGKSVSVVSANDNWRIQSESLHTELIIKDEDCDEASYNSRYFDDDDKQITDKCNLRNQTELEIKPNFNESVPMVYNTIHNLQIKNETSLHTELIIKDEDCDETSEDSYNSDEQTYTDASNVNNLKPHLGKRFSCDKCDKKYNRIGKLIMHNRIHTGEKPFSCDFCDKKFPRQETLKMHKLIHTGEKSHSCDVCNKKFTYKSALTMHKRTHSGEKPYSCETCDRKFAGKDLLEKHKQTHTGEKNFSCNVCDKKFTRRSTLTNHKRAHTGEKLPRPFECEVCVKKFTSQSVLIVHKRVHTGEKPFTCDICDKKFPQKFPLDQHKLIHEGKKPFSCDVCKKKFRMKHHLSQHKRSHTGEKPYTCDVCDKKYFKNQDLVKHKKKHAGE